MEQFVIAELSCILGWLFSRYLCKTRESGGLVLCGGEIITLFKTRRRNYWIKAFKSYWFTLHSKSCLELNLGCSLCCLLRKIPNLFFYSEFLPVQINPTYSQVRACKISSLLSIWDLRVAPHSKKKTRSKYLITKPPWLTYFKCIMYLAFSVHFRVPSKIKSGWGCRNFLHELIPQSFWKLSIFYVKKQNKTPNPDSRWINKSP